MTDVQIHHILTTLLHTSLELHTLAAQAALTIKDYTSLTVLCNSVSRNSRRFEDSLETSFVAMSYLMQSKMDESVRYGISTLIKLDVIISESTSQDTIVRQLYQTKAMLQAMSDETILSKQIMTDFKSIMALKFLTR